jgi:hypothetical protein
MMIRTIVFALVFLAFSASAWNSVGHKLIAEMVWQKMSASARRQATQLLTRHPHYKELLTAHVSPGVDEGEWAFLTAAIWPDLVRPNWEGKTESIAKYDVYPHTIGYPFMLAEETNHALVENFFIAKPDAEMVLSNAFVTLRNKNASPHDRAVSLCWALHLCGDLHQPLHAATLVTKEHPRGDGVGGSHIVLDEHGQPVAMHMFWDCLPGLEETYPSLKETARKLAGNKTLKRMTRGDLEQHKTISSWVQESHRLATDFAYQGGRLRFAHQADLDSGKVGRSQIPKLSLEYVSQAHEVAERRLILAAQRLSRELNQSW